MIEHQPGRLLDQVLGRAGVVGPRGDADVDRLRPGVRRDDRVRGPQHGVPEQVGDLRFADPCQPVGPGRDRPAEPEFPQPRQRLVRPHRAHLARRPGQRDDDPAVGSGDEPARGGAIGIGQRTRRREEPGLLEVELGECDPAARPELAQPGLELGVHDRRLAAGRGDRLAGQVVRCRPEPARRDHEIDPVEGSRERRGDVLELVRGGP